MKMTKFSLAIAVAFQVLALTGAQAAPVTANATIDLSSAITGNSWTGYGHALDSAVRVYKGDTVTINLDFLGNQQLTWNGGGYFHPWLMLAGYPGALVDNSQAGGFSWTGLSVNLLGLTQGTQFGAAQLDDGSSGSIHLGPTFELAGLGITRTFSGATVSFVANWNEASAYRDYGTIGYQGLYLFDGQVSASQAATVPEPAGIALALTALGGLWLTGRRRSTRTRV